MSEFNESMSTPIKIQIYIELFQSLLARVSDTYTLELEKTLTMELQTKQKCMALVIEISNNI